MKPARIVASLGLALLVAGPLAPASAQQSRADKPRELPPPPLPVKAVAFPTVHERTLENGARVIIVENHEQPIVSLDLRIRSGTALDPSDKPGVAGFTAALLDKGTATRTSRQIAESIDFVGGTLGAGAGADWTNVSATGLTEFLDTALVLLSDVVLNATFPAEELEIERKRTLSGLQVELSQPQSLAARRFAREVYGEHPYGASLTPESVRSIRREDLVAFHGAHFRPENALFVVAGDVRPADVVARLDRHFAGWKRGAAVRPKLPAPPPRQQRDIVFIHKPGLVQAVIRIGHLLPPATHADWVALDVANQVLGGGTTGWFFRILRGEKGYTYGAYASAAKRLEPGYFQASAEVRNEVADSAIAEFFNLLGRIRREPVPADDLRKARDYMTGSFPRGIETPQQVARQVADTRLLGLPQDYLARYRERVAAVTAAAIQKAASTHLQPDRAVVVVVGDATRILDKLSRFGPVRLYDVSGRPIQRADLEARASGVKLDASAIEPQTLVHELRFQESPIAQVTTIITRETIEGKQAVKVSTSAAGMISIKGETAFEAAGFAPLYSRGEQQAGPARTAHDLKVAGGKVTGTLAGADGKTSAVDVATTPGMLLPGMSEYAIWVADLAAGAAFAFPSVSTQTGAATTLHVKVVGEGKVAVGAGEFEVYELEVSGEGPTMRLFARKAAPHLIVKQEFAGQPVTIELKEVR